MDLVMLDDFDKENHISTGPSATYPHLPKLSPDHKLLAKHERSPPPSTPQANTGRRRPSHLTILTNTPSRPSHSTKMSSIFARVALPAKSPLRGTPVRLNRRGEKVNMRTIRFGDLSSPNSDEDPLDDLLRASELPASPSDSVMLGVQSQDGSSNDSPGELRKERCLSPPHNTLPMSLGMSTATSEKATSKRIAWLEDAVPVDLPAQGNPSTPSLQSSSDEWTGDEEFLPRSARRRHREQRLAVKQAATGKYLQPQQLPPSPLYPRLPTSMDGHSRPHSSRPSRFQFASLKPQQVVQEIPGPERMSVSSYTDSGPEEANAASVKCGSSDADDDEDGSES